MRSPESRPSRTATRISPRTHWRLRKQHHQPATLEPVIREPVVNPAEQTVEPQALPQTPADHSAAEDASQAATLDLAGLRLLGPMAHSPAHTQRFSDLMPLTRPELEHRWRLLIDYARALDRSVVIADGKDALRPADDHSITIGAQRGPIDAIVTLEQALADLTAQDAGSDPDARLLQALTDGRLPTVTETMAGEPLALPDTTDPDALIAWTLQRHDGPARTYRHDHEVWSAVQDVAAQAGLIALNSTTGAVEVDHDRRLIAIPPVWTTGSRQGAINAVLAMATATVDAVRGRDAALRTADAQTTDDQWHHRWLQLTSLADRSGLIADATDDNTVWAQDSDAHGDAAAGQQWRLEGNQPVRERVRWLSRRIAAEPSAPSLFANRPTTELSPADIAGLPYLCELPGRTRPDDPSATAAKDPMPDTLFPTADLGTRLAIPEAAPLSPAELRLFREAVTEGRIALARTEAAGGHYPEAWHRFGDLVSTNPETARSYTATEEGWETTSEWWVTAAANALAAQGYQAVVLPPARRRHPFHIQVDHERRLVLVNDRTVDGTRAWELVERVAELANLASPGDYLTSSADAEQVPTVTAQAERVDLHETSAPTAQPALPSGSVTTADAMDSDLATPVDVHPATGPVGPETAGDHDGTPWR